MQPSEILRFILIGSCLALSLDQARASDPTGVEFFEEKIRPVLVEKCYRCHSAEAEEAGKLKANLLLDRREGMLLGGDSGPAVVPGKPEESSLIEALRYEFLMMPPEGKLPDPVIADFETWIEHGAFDPRDGQIPAAPKPGIDLEAGRQHWAYQPPEATTPPVVEDTSWPINDVDRFVLGRLEAESLRPVSEADRGTLIRRLSFDLIGLPPTPEEVDAFLADASPTAYEDLVDRLLASPHFGERWGRHWLDVSRFAESFTLRGLILGEAWRYRDFVIDAFNDDMPFDRFVREQVAGDLMPAESLEDRRRQRIATGFLALGNTNLEEQDKEQLRMDVVDEQVDTIGKALLGQTIGCARCHDHKFDPIPTADYYALAGILRNARAMNHANVSEWIEVPLPMEPDREAAVKAHQQAVAALEARVEEGRAKAGERPAGGVLALADAPGIVVDDAQAGKVGNWADSTYSGTFLGEGYLHDENAGKGEKTLTFQPDIPEAGPFEVWLAYSPGGSRAKAVPVSILSADGETTIPFDMSKPPPIDGRYASLGRFRFESNDQGFVQISNEGTSGHVTADAVLFIPASEADGLSSVSLAAVDEADEAATLKALEAELKRLREDAPPRDMALSVLEEEEIGDSRIHIRGTVHSLGDEVPRGFLRVATFGAVAPLPDDESGRLELADWIASPENPLTARVIVNRAWHWIFGSGLVRTVDNFGTTGESPSHPELLDTLAVRFMDEGWSIKSLVRTIVLSRTYRLSTDDDPTALADDPENRLLWRMNRRRLEAECIRDAILSASGQLDRAMGGRTFPADLKADYGFDHADERRSVYAPVFRNALPELFEAFDFADPSMVVGRRNSSTVAPQALFLLNHPFVIEQSRAAARRLLAEVPEGDGARVDRAYRLLLGRRPTDDERLIALRFLDGRGDDAEDAYALLIQALFASIDFRYLR
jgi:hypothetical protein